MKRVRPFSRYKVSANTPFGKRLVGSRVARKRTKNILLDLSIDLSIEKSIDKKDVTRDEALEILTEQFNQTSSMYCSTRDDREKFKNDLLKRLPKEQGTPFVIKNYYKQRRDKKKNVFDFLRSEYPNECKTGLKLTDLKQDQPLYTAIYNYLRKNDLPSDIKLLTKADVVTQEVEAQDPAELRDKGRIAVAKWRRAQQRNNM